ncbi:MAG: DNA polymerase IV [Clostridiales bacterium]|jgi:DNA polymerase-4|nr:DNA polymerase IV [Clostridiales bacterium]
MERTVLHCDCNAFFASVEATRYPKLKKQPFAVCGDPKLRHGIVLAKNEKAKRLGVQTGEAIWQAKAKCPDLVLVEPSYGIYDEFSERIFNIYCRYTDLVEPFGIDECWLDVTGTKSLFGSGEKIADELRKIVKSETGITISAGVSFNKYFAKMGSDYKKPDATTVLTRNNYKDILFPLSVENMLFVGKSTLEKLSDIGIYTIGDLANADAKLLSLTLGKCGQMLYNCANGLDFSVVTPSTYKHKYKSIGNGYTFKRDLVSDTDLKTGIYMICDKVAHRLRKQKLECKTVQLCIKDTHFHAIQRQKTLQNPTQSSYELANSALELAINNWNVNDKPIRSMSVTGQNLIERSNEPEQLSLFYTDSFIFKRKKVILESTKDEICEKYGNNVLRMCSLIDNDLGL